MSATIEFELMPWGVPIHATVKRPPSNMEGGIIALPIVPISDLSEAALQALTEQWILDLYAKAGKPSPWTIIIRRLRVTDRGRKVGLSKVTESQGNFE